MDTFKIRAYICPNKTLRLKNVQTRSEQQASKYMDDPNNHRVSLNKYKLSRGDICLANFIPMGMVRF